MDVLDDTELQPYCHTLALSSMVILELVNGLTASCIFPSEDF